MLEQYFEIKRQVPDAILFYRLGDFYEMFFEDAEKAAPILDLVLTARGRGGESEAPMCGVPYHSCEQHIARLIRRGFKVAVCEQVEDPAAAKGLVKREIIRIVTPGTAIDSALVDREASYLLAWCPDGTAAGAAYLDVSTGDLVVTHYGGVDDLRLRDDIIRFSPREVIFPADAGKEVAEFFSRLSIAASGADADLFDVSSGFDYLTRQFATQSLRGYGLDEGDKRIGAAAATLRYAAVNHRRELSHVTTIRQELESDFLLLDASTLENLEIFESREERARGSLWKILNCTKTAMGGRVLRSWICRPLAKKEAIFDRHDAADELTRSRVAHDGINSALQRIADLERLASRVTLRTVTPRELLTLADSLQAVASLRAAASQLAGPLLRSICERLDDVSGAVEKISATIEAETSQSVKDGGVIRAGVHEELDSLRSIARDSKSILLKIEEEERARTGIPSLKVRYNSVFGYYIEVSKANLARVPPDYIRKQTLVNAERFITPPLKELEEKILGAEEKSIRIEVQLYGELVDAIAESVARVLATARAAGELDALASLATVATKSRFVRAELSDDTEICVEEGRHPVVETLTRRFIPNDTVIRREENGIQIITGPNMGGKSTYLRQVALIVLMNQIGSFVPATKARLGVFDRIFTRVGASDNLARGESTFMVEMHETANILNSATPKSLIVLDEVGRGTATFDGLSLAWAIVEFLHDTASRNAITLFATHYHELTDLAKSRDRIANMNVSVKEWNDQIIFLHKVVPGTADKSYGIHVAKLAGIPQGVVERAQQILETLEKKERDVVAATQPRGEPRRQIPLFETPEQKLLRELNALDLDTMSPLEALNRLHQWKKNFRE